MGTRRFAPILPAVWLLTLLLAPLAHAQATRTWVSGVGDDANPCSRTAPCKTFAGAISKTAAGGEISVLDPGGYGAVTITKSITLNGTGTLASILASGVSGIIVNAGASAEVIIRNIHINGAGSGLSGVRYLSAGRLTLDQVFIYNFGINAGTAGVYAAPAGNGRLVIRDTAITTTGKGVHLSPAAWLEATLDNVRIESATSHGVEAATGTVLATISRSTISGNALDGVRASGGTARIYVEDSVLAFNSVGVNAAVAGARIYLSNSAILRNNSAGIAIAPGAVVHTAGNNRVEGNGASDVPNATIPLQ